MDFVTTLLTILTIGGIGTAVYLYTSLNNEKENYGGHDFNEREALDKAQEIADTKIREAEDLAKIIQSNIDKSLQDIRDTLKEKEVELEESNQLIEEREKILKERTLSLTNREANISKLKEEQADLNVKLNDLLKKIANIDESIIEASIKTALEKDISDFISTTVNIFETNLKVNADDVAEEIIEEIIPAAAVDYVGDSTNSYIPVQSEGEVKKIAGVDNKNMQKLIELTNVEINTDATSQDGKRKEIHVTSLDTIRREVATRVILNALSARQTIDPNWIQVQVDKEKSALLKDVKEAGEYACKELGLEYLPDKLKIILGKCKYRFSYGQNLLKHSIEMAKLGVSLAHILGADEELSKLACFLHDIGKVEPDEEKPHHHISADLVKEFYSDNEVLYNAIIAHHFDVDAKYIEAHIVRIADSISGARPGARRNSAEEYFEKVRALDEIASTYTGVKKVQVMNGAREVRVMVKPNEVDDAGTDKLAQHIAEEVEDKLSYPGSISVKVIRATQSTATANIEQETHQ